MRAKQLSAFIILTMVSFAMTQPVAQGNNGAQKFNQDTLDSFIITDELFVGVFAQRSESQFGDPSFAVVNVFNFLTNDFRQCVSTDFDLIVNNGRALLSFVTESGFNCPAGESVLVDCNGTTDTFAFHNVMNGRASMPSGKFTTHGRIDQWNNLSCVLTALGADGVSPGSASRQRMTVTP